MLNKLLTKLIKLLQSIFIFIYIVFEDIIWEQFAQPIFRYLKHLRVFLRLEIILRSSNRYIVLFLFLLPFIVGELLGILSAVIALKGLFILAVILYILKLLVVAFAFWLFNTQKEKLLSFKIINLSYEKIVQFTMWMKTTEIFIYLKNQILIIKKAIKDKIVIVKNWFNQ